MGITESFVGITEAKNRLPQVVKDLEKGDAQEVYVLKNNVPVAVVVSPDRYESEEKLREQVEHLEDALLVLESRMSDSGKRHNLDDVLTELGTDF